MPLDTVEALIDRLTELAGLAITYEDVFGQTRGPDLEARSLLLKGLGYDIADAEALRQAIKTLEAADKRSIPPIVVVWVADGTDKGIVNIPVVTKGAKLRWQLWAEMDLPENTPRNGVVDVDAVSMQLPLGLYRLTIQGSETTYHTSIIVAPEQCYLPPVLRNGRKVWGISAQIYSLRSKRNWGIGDYSDLTAIAVKAARAGADLIGINPIHARSLFRPEDASPYAPVSRLALDALAIDIEAVPELGIADEAREKILQPAFQAKLSGLRETTHVDYTGVAQIKLEVLRMLHNAFLSHGSTQRHNRFTAFVESGGTSLRYYAEFEAVRASHAIKNEGDQSWWQWSEARRDRDRTALEAEDLRSEISFQLYLQFEAHEQLATADAAARAAGMTIGIYRDLAVASARDGAEAWARPDLISKLSVGAAPDAYSDIGQNWGLPATNPHILTDEVFRPFAALIAANMDRAGALRLDHAMALQRLFVIPEGHNGKDGTFLLFPFEAMTAVVALQSWREQCLVIGEDLGSVPKGFVAAMAKRRILAYKIVTFEVEDNGELRSPRQYPHLACAMFSTHDMPTITGYLEGRDIETRVAVGQITEEMAVKVREAREEERIKILRLLEREGVPFVGPGLPSGKLSSQVFVDAVHLVLARSSAAIAMAQLDDILGELDAVNLPGTSTEHANWRRKLHLDMEDTAFEAAFERSTALFRAERSKRRYLSEGRGHSS